jgi:hypothetical protein
MNGAGDVVPPAHQVISGISHGFPAFVADRPPCVVQGTSHANPGRVRDA